MNQPERLFTDRSQRGKLRLTGPQRAWFLHQILTQSLEDIGPGEAREAAMLTVHGRMVGYMEILATGEGLLVHFEPDLRESLPDAIRKYVFATQVEIEDVSDEMGLVLVAGQGWRDSAAAAAPGAPQHPTLGIGVDAGYVWVDRADLGEVHKALLASGLKQASEEELESLRIASGIARWGFEMTPKTLPQEARIEDRAVNFQKGCYVGQEAVAKIHFRGKVNRLVRTLSVSAPVSAGTDVYQNGDVVGVVTSASGRKALAMLRYTVEPGAELRAGEAQATVDA